MDDREVLHQIERLVAEEHDLWNRGADGALSDEERARLRALQETLDQCWDFLRQRRARRAAGLDPDEARPRDKRTVEQYLQ